MTVSTYNEKTKEYAVIPETVGTTIYKGTHNYWDDWDNYVVWYNEEKQELDSLVYNSSRYHASGCRITIDVRDDILYLLQEKKRMKLYKEYLDAMINRKQIDAGDKVTFCKSYKPRKGTFAGHKFEIGTMAKVFWIGENFRGMTTVGVAIDEELDENGRFKNVLFVALDKLEVVNEYTEHDYMEMSDIAMEHAIYDSKGSV
jgi:hypothetical protein